MSDRNGDRNGDKYKRRRIDDQRAAPQRETINNPKHQEELKIPEGVKFGDLFEPSNRNGIDGIPHPDGSLKCNNWHYRGWCKKSGCKFKKSQNKDLTEEEVTEGKKFVAALYEKFKNNGERT